MSWTAVVLLAAVFSTPGFGAGKSETVKVVVELRDGSRLVGQSPVKFYPFVRQDGKKMRLSIAHTVAITTDKDRELYTVQLADRALRGVVDMKKLAVVGVFGRCEVPFAEVTHIEFIQPTLSLIAHYQFDGDCRDASGNNNHGEPHGDVGFVKGKLGKAASFDGKGDYVSIEPKSDVSKIGDFTISAWVYVKEWKKLPAGIPFDLQYVFDGYSDRKRGNFNSQGFALICQSQTPFGPCLYGFVSVDRTNYRGYRPATVLLKRWRLLTFMRKGKREFAYVDGKLLQSTPSYAAGTTTRLLNMTHTWFIGTFAANDPRYPSRGLRYDFHGRIDDLRIYNRALNNTEIRELASAAR